MEEILNVDLPGFKASYKVEWFDDTDFSKLKNIKQVYGIIFNDEGKIIIINTVGNWQVPGGKPENEESFQETLIRESIEEADIEIEDIIPLGYQKVEEINDNINGTPFYQLRYFAKIKNINESTIDPATGKIPERKFILPEEFLNYCPWGEIGKYIVDKANKIYIQKTSSHYLDFMEPLKDLFKYREQIDKAIEMYHPKIINSLFLTSVSKNIKFIDLSNEIQKGIYEPNWDMLNRKKSYLRPIIFLLIISGLNKEPKDFIEISSILEIIHNGTLIHDDIEDDAKIRRGDKPIYLKYGTDIAVNSANVMYFSPFLLIKKYKNILSKDIHLKIYESLIEHLNRVSWGQAIDIVWHKENNIPSVEEYLQMCCYKTGAIDKMVFSIAGIVCDVNKEIQINMEKFGEEFGILLQIHDDFSDVCSINRDLIGGKIMGNDISEGKKSLINILALESLELEEKDIFLSTLSEHTTDPIKIKTILNLINKSDALKKSLEISNSIIKSLIEKSKCIFNSECNSKMETFLMKLQEDMINKFNYHKNAENN